MAYGLKYTQYIEKGGAQVQIKVYEKDWAGASYGMAHVTGLSLQIIGGQSNILSPLLKTSLSFSLVDAYDQGTTQADGTACVNAQNEKCGRWEEFFTPDATKYKVELISKPSPSASASVIWTGFITPDSWSENMIYRGSVTITARDMLGALQDKEFDLTGRVSVRDVITGALAACECPMALQLTESHFLVNSNGHSILDHTFAASTFSGDTWAQAIEKTLDSLGLVLRYNGTNNVVLTSLRYLAADTTIGAHGIEFINRSGLRQLDPALKSITETFDVDILRIDAADPDATQFAATGSNLTQKIVTHLSNGATMTNTNYIPAYTLAQAGGEGWSGSLAVPQLGTPTDDIAVRKMYIPTDIEESVEATYYNPRLRGTFAFKFTQDGPLAWLTGSAGALKLSHYWGGDGVEEIRVRVEALVNGVRKYLSGGGDWTTSADSFVISVGQEVSVPDSGAVGVSIVIVKVKAATHLPAYNAVFAALNLSVSPASEGTALISEWKTTTNYDQANNVTIKRDPSVGSAGVGGCVDFYGNVLAYGDAIATDEWNWSGAAGGYPLAVMIQAQVLCFHAAAASVFTGTAHDKATPEAAALPGYRIGYYDRVGVILSGTYDFCSGFVAQTIAREFYTWEEVWGTFDPDYTTVSGAGKGSTSATGAGGSSAGSGSGGSSGGGGGASSSDLRDVEYSLASGLAWLSSRIGSIESWLAEPQLDELLVGDLNVERQINLAGATLTYHPAANGNAAYVYLDTALVTKGDQVTNDGTPGSGGGGGGGKNWLAELLDVEENMHPSGGQVLAWKTGIELNDGTTGDGWGNLTLGALATRNNITTSFVTDIETWIAGKGYATQAWVQEQGYVTTSGVTSIAMTVPTGFSVTGSPITSTGTLALAFASGYSLPTTAKQSNWDTAYGWGNHATAGYAMQTDLAAVDANVAQGLANLAGRMSSVEAWLECPQIDELLVGDINVERELNLGGAIFKWVPPQGNNAGYVLLDTHFVTLGDQVTNEGNPSGGSGGGGKNWLAELLDVEADMAPTVGQVLAWQDNVERNDGTTAPGWANLSLGALALRDSITTSFITDLETWIAGKGYVTSSGVTSVAMTVPTGFAIAGSPITTTGTLALTFASGYSLPTDAKQTQWDTAYTNSHTHANKSVLDGITSTKVSNWDTAYTNNHTHSNKSVLDGISSTEVSHWDTAYTNNHTHANKGVLDGISSSDVTNWNTAFTNNHTHSNKTVLDGITSTDVSHWDTAYGWGNHALAGYAYASDQEKIEAALAAGLALLAGRISGLEDWLAEPQLDELLVGDINVERVLNVGGATFVYHPAEGANAAYIYLDTALVTAGDQVTNDGNPGSGGGGSGKSWLSELLDVKASMAPSAGQVLMWQNNVVRNDGTTAPGWANASLGALATRDNITTAYVTDLETWIAGKGYVTTSGVTSIAVTVPTGFAVSGSPVTSTGTVAIDFATGYSLPTTAKQTNWDTAYSDHHTHSNKITLDGITSSQVTNWDSAYSWGNHASVGYAMGTDLAAVERGAVQADAALSARISSLEDWFSEPQLDELLVGSLCADNINLGGESMRSIPNAFLANSALTINGSVTALGSSFNTANITAGTAGTSSATSGVSFAIPYVTMNKYGIVTAYGTHTHSISQANMFGSSAIGSSALPVYYNGSALTACTKGDLFSALSSSAATNLSVTVAGQTRSITNLYATYDSEGSNIATQAHAIERILAEGVAGVSARVKSLEDWFAEPQVDELLAGAVNVERTLNLGGISMRASGNKLYIGDAGHYIEIKGTNSAPILYMNVTLQTAGDQAIA